MSGSNYLFAEQLNTLFARSSQRTTNLMVARALIERGCSISAPYLSQLRNGARTRPADRYVRVIAEYFEVPLSHFYEAPFESDTDTDLSQDLVLIRTINNAPVRRLLHNTHGLSPASIDILLRFADRLRILE